MALLQIAEPGQSTAPHEHRLAAGIDLGTTHSLVATLRSGKAEALPDSQGRQLLPSVVRYRANHPPQVGWEARAARVTDPTNTIASVKRLLGRGYDEIAADAHTPYALADETESTPRLLTAAGAVSPVEVSGEILKVLRRRAEQALGGKLSGIVLTVPAYFDDAQRQATRDAAQLAGLKVLRLLNEPTAAAIAYGLDRASEGVHAVYDLGGGTFDISLLRFSKGVFEVIATAGDTALGGDDMDQAVVGWIQSQSGLSNPDASERQMILRAAVKAKESLSSKTETDIQLHHNGRTLWQGQLTRTEFDSLIEKLVRRTLVACRRALRDGAIEPAEITEVVMVGGATRVPLVRQLVGEFFGRNPLVDIDPDRVVALGAALQADILVGNKPESDMLLLDVTPLSLGIETMGGLVEKIVPRNATLPLTRAQEFTTFKDGQTAMALHVVQGEREMVDDCRSLARFELRGIPPMVAGAARIRVIFQIDADGILSVTAREETQGIESHVDVKPSYGLKDGEIEQMLKDSLSYAEEDVQQRLLREQRVEAEGLLLAINSALDKDRDLLTPEEAPQVQQAIERLQQASSCDDLQQIKQAIEQLAKVTEAFAARRMDNTIRAALSGRAVEQINKTF
ncbi:MAG: Fe-S protein assembly chaperone HscA [Gammaproteobacteria bacterium]|nr:Fe-S protein assembly chaperone HscA [Gammaproteobacteria bacterium]